MTHSSLSGIHLGQFHIVPAVPQWDNQSGTSSHFPFLYFLAISLLILLGVFFLLRNLRQRGNSPSSESSSDSNLQEVLADLPILDLDLFLSNSEEWPPKFPRNLFFLASDKYQLGGSGHRMIPAKKFDKFTAWTASLDNLFVAAFWSEKVTHNGEDAIPLLVTTRKGKRVVSSVLDGLGGSGASKVTWSSGRAVSNAWEAPRIVRSAFEALATEDPSLEGFSQAIPKGLETIAKTSLTTRAETLVKSRGLSSSFSRVLPTTLAGFELNVSNAPRLSTFWAGDSRVYLLEPRLGLQVLTLDDAGDSDAFNSLSSDPPLNNVLCADRLFVIHHRIDELPEKGIVVAATDGCFNYWPTPPNFEFEILNALKLSRNWEETVSLLGESISQVTNDDASMTLSAFGYQSFEEIQSSFHLRHTWLEEIAYTPLVAIRNSSGSREQFDDYRRSAWNEYKAGYENRLGDVL